MRNPIIAALDVSRGAEALILTDKLKGVVGGFKVGSELFTAAGPEIVHRIRATGGLVFLDLKFHDIPNTVAKAVKAAARLGVEMMNVHASGGLAMMKAAEEAAKESAKELGIPVPIILGVTVLTSLDNSLMNEVGIVDADHQVTRLAKLAMKANLGGLVCSPLEVAQVRALVPPEFQLVVPGIRLSGADKQDQKRTGTPNQAIEDGANWLVIGRPICAANNPRQAAEEILASLTSLERV